MIELLSGFSENVLAVAGHGQVTGKDYEQVLVPAMEQKLRAYKKIRLFYRLGGDFSGYTASALWDDVKVGLQNLTAFEKIAVVADVQWVVEAVKFFGFFVPCPVKVFGNDKAAEAKAWVSG